MRNMNFGCAIGAIAVAIVATAPAQAQETTSTIRGTVTTGGAPIAGAAVTVTHVPSGTRSIATTDANGTFNANGLRVGGPFTIVVTAPGQPSTTITDINTVVGQPYELPIDLASTGSEIVVTAASIPQARTLSQGPATLLTTADIAKVATINRDVRDLMRRDPFARLDYAEGSGRAVSFAGQNARFNRFTVDGVPITDNFGLNPDGLPSRRSPIPLDAIGQFQTKVAPYDVREGNFQGGTINVVLRSGGNDFQGTGFYSYSSDELTGKKTKAGPGVTTGKVTLPNFTLKNYGAELSGPIIKDKLFFMIAGESLRAGTPIAEGPTDNNAGTAIPNLTQAQVDNISNIAKSKYNYATGGVLNNSADKDDRLVGKIDANLSETQRLSLTGTYTKDSILFNQNSFPTGTTPGLGLESNGYRSSNRLYTGVIQLNSDWSDEFSTEARAFIKDYKRGQDPILGRGFAQMQICTAPTSDRGNPGTAGTGASTTCQSGFNTVSIGPDVSRQSNELTSKTYGGLLQARLQKGNHDIRAVADIQGTKIFNLFLQRTAGDYYFDSIADFQAGNAQRLRYQNAVPSLDPANAAAKFGYISYSFGLQDTWRISDELSVAYGLRYDTYGGDSRAALNPVFTNTYGFTNQAFVDGRQILQPRLGITYKPTPRLSVRGGAGIFSGGSPDVYVSNSFSNTGFLSNSIDIRQNNDGTYTGTGLPAGVGAAALTNVTGTSIPGSVNTYLANGSVAATAPTNALDPKFKLPSQWRGTLSFDYDADLGALGDKWHFGADAFYSAVRNQVFFTDIRSIPTALRTPDGRVRYASRTSFTDTNSDLFLTNTKKGRSYVFVARVDKSFNFGLSGGASFTYQDVKDQAPATSSTASSNYGNGAFLDANGAAYGISNDEVKYNIKYNLTYEHAFFDDYKTTIALFGETRIGRPYSYTFQDVSTARSGVFGTIGSNSRYLMYVPTGISDALVSYDTAATATTIDNFINANGLSKYRGKIAPRNAFNARWFTRVDLHLSQEFPVPILGGKSRITLFADVENFTNMLNKNWGQVREYAFPYNVVAARVQCLTAPVATGTTPTAAQTVTTTAQTCAQYRYTAPLSTPTDTIYSRQSLYAIRVGARFSF